MDVQQINTMKITGAEICIKSLINEKVDTIFGYPGGAIMPVYDALHNHSNNIKHILVRHEQGAIHAAQGYARASGKTGVCIATSGPGATNLITGLADALADSTPLVCITGQVNSKLLGTDAFQETDVISMCLAATKWCIQVIDADKISETIAKAFYIASTGRPGPVLVDITKNAQTDLYAFIPKKFKSVAGYFPQPCASTKEINEFKRLLQSSKKPLVLAGQGIVLSKTETDLLNFCEKTKIPVACTLLGLGVFPKEHELYAGFLGMHGNLAANKLTNECDLLIALGMRFDDRVTGNLNTYAKQARIVHIDIDKAELNKNVNADLAIHSDLKSFFNLLGNDLPELETSNWIKEFKKLNQIENAALKGKPKSEQLKMEEVIEALNHYKKTNTYLVTDVGQHQMAAARNFNFKSEIPCITSGGLGTMGFGLPAAIGAKIAKPENDVVLVVGDGGLQMTIQEFGTIMQEKTGVKILLLNNNYLGMVRQWQELFFEKRYSFTEMKNPDFEKLCSAYTINYLFSDSRSDLNNKMNAFIRCKEPVLLEVLVENEENVFPMIPAGGTVSEMIFN